LFALQSLADTADLFEYGVQKKNEYREPGDDRPKEAVHVSLPVVFSIGQLQPQTSSSTDRVRGPLSSSQICQISISLDFDF